MHIAAIADIATLPFAMPEARLRCAGSGNANAADTGRRALARVVAVRHRMKAGDDQASGFPSAPEEAASVREFPLSGTATGSDTTSAAG